MTQVVNMVLDQLVEYLTQYMITDLAEDNPIRADLVKKGLLQENKVESNIQIGVSGGDHDQPDDMDGIITLDKLPDIGIDLPSREIGGTQLWMRRGVVRLECFFIAEGYDEDTAHGIAYDCLGRVLELVGLAPVHGLTDEYGEKVIMIHCYANTFFESGGPPASYIFRGKIFWAIYTERP